jgi:argininosuccinate lyase
VDAVQAFYHSPDFEQVNAEKMREALTMDVLATDLADYLVRKGVRPTFLLTTCVTYYHKQIPFRETHHISGRAVALAEARQCHLNDLTLTDYKALSDKFTDDIQEVFDFEASVERRESIGGPSRKMVDRQIAVLREFLAQ